MGDRRQTSAKNNLRYGLNRVFILYFLTLNLTTSLKTKIENSVHCDSVYLNVALHERATASRQCEAALSFQKCVIYWLQTVCCVKAVSNSRVLKRDLAACIFQTNVLGLRCLPARLLAAPVISGISGISLGLLPSVKKLPSIQENQCRREGEGGSRCKLSGPGSRERGPEPGARLCCICFCLSR